MPTVTLTVVPGKALKDGRNKVRLSIAHNSQTRYIATDVILNSPKEWKNGKVVRRDDATYLNTKLLARLNEVQRIIDEIPYIEGLTCAELVECITETKVRRSHTLRSAFEEMMSVSSAKQSSKASLAYKFKAIEKIIPGDTLVSRLTPAAFRRFVKARSKTTAPATIQTDVSLLSMVLKYCQDNGYAEYRTLPTKGCLKTGSYVRQNWLSPDEVRAVRDCAPKLKRQQRYRDFFMLSYYLGGINAVDIARIDFNECGDILHYVRCKTERCGKVNPYVEFEIPDEAKSIIKKYSLPNGKVATPRLVFPKSFGELLGIPQLTFYSARKSFAQHAFALGISESVIDYILGHSLGSRGNKMLYSYVKVTPEMATDAVRKVCDFIASSENF